jgi:uncharacterized phiE125 gp8 family phage protein
MHKTQLVTAPTEDPITVAEAKDHLNIRGNSRDTYINGLISAVTKAVETYLHRALITQSWKVFYDRFHDHMKIPFGSLQTVTGITYYDLNGNAQTFSNSLYWVVKETDPACIIRKYEVTFPETQYGRPNAVEIAFTCGYGSASAVPEPIKHAMKLMLTNYFEHRGDIVSGPGIAAMKIPGHITDLIHPYRLYYF